LNTPQPNFQYATGFKTTLTAALFAFFCTRNNLSKHGSTYVVKSVCLHWKAEREISIGDRAVYKALDDFGADRFCLKLVPLSCTSAVSTVT
jgi:hypothetical protein